MRSVRSPTAALLALILLLGVGGYVLTQTVIRGDRDAAATRRAEAEAVHAQEVLGRARAYVAGLADVLAGEPTRGAAPFGRLARGTSASVGLNDVLWVQRVPGSARARYERLHGVPITRLTPSGRFRRAPAARVYYPATFTSLSRPELRPGVDVANFPALGAAIRDRSTIYAVGASRPGSMGGEPGFYLLEAATFARGPGNSGYLAAFVPRGWFTTTLSNDPRLVAVTLGGRRIDGNVQSIQATSSFDFLGRRWGIEVGRGSPSELQSTLPWLALAWPFAAAGIVFLVGRAITLRRRAQRDVERLFDVSLDPLAIIGFDGYYKAVNPAFERTLGYSRQEMLARPAVAFVHPDDREATQRAFDDIAGGADVAQFEHRGIGANGSTRWLQWSGRAVPEQRVIYGVARDVTERRRIDAELRAAHRTAEARGAELRVRADGQAALRRVATLVARGESSQAIFEAVTAELRGLLEADTATLLRYEPDDTATVLAIHGRETGVGKRLTLEGDSVTGAVFRTGFPARMDEYTTAPGAAAEWARSEGIGSGVGAPISLEGRLWGLVYAGWATPNPPFADAEDRIAQFTELVATAIANAESRAALTASRARLVAASDEARRRFERDLHDGVQQRLVSLSLELHSAKAMAAGGNAELVAQLTRLANGLAGAIEDVRELSRGIHPAILSKGGLVPALKTLARRSAVPVKLDLAVDGRLGEHIEAGAYYVVSEALTNVAKHAQASKVEVGVRARDGALEMRIDDDGIGGADPAQGSGLTGLVDRVEALGGTIAIASPPGRGTTVSVELPVEPR